MLEAWKGHLEPGSEEEGLAREIDPGRLPAHVAVIMDGNGRWAQARNRPRVDGHRAGIKSVKEIVETAARPASASCPSMPFPRRTGGGPGARF